MYIEKQCYTCIYWSNLTILDGDRVIKYKWGECRRSAPSNARDFNDEEKFPKKARWLTNSNMRGVWALTALYDFCGEWEPNFDVIGSLDPSDYSDE